MNQVKKSFDVIGISKTIFLVSLIPWIIILPFLGMTADYATASKTGDVFRTWFSYPIIGGALILIGSFFQKKGYLKLAKTITSIPAIFVILTFLTFVVIVVSTIFSVYPNPFSKKAYYSGQIVISFKDGVTQTAGAEILRRHDLEFSFYPPKDVPTKGYHIISVKEGQEDETVRVLLNEPLIKSADYGFDYSSIYKYTE